MSRPLSDKSVCRVCLRDASQVKIPLVKGVPRGICYQCRRCADRGRYHVKRAHLQIYRHSPSLVSVNYQILASLPPGVYGVFFRLNPAFVGWLLIKDGAFILDVWGRLERFEYNLMGMSLLLGNQNLILNPDFPLSEASIIAAEEIGETTECYPLLNPFNHICMLDRKVVERAVDIIEKKLR